MSKFWKIIIVVLVVLIAMVLITYFVPEVRKVGEGLTVSTKLPLWIVGLFAPIVFLLRKIGGIFSGLFGGGSTEKSIRDENEAIKAELVKLRAEVSRIDEWRTREIDIQRREIELMRKNFHVLEGRDRELAERYAQLQHMSPEEVFRNPPDPAFRVNPLKPLEDLGITRDEGTPIQ